MTAQKNPTCYRNILSCFFFPVLSLFTIVSFKNDACQSGTGNNGTCYSSSDCSKLGGTASGSCASGFGVCCLCKFSKKINHILTPHYMLAAVRCHSTAANHAAASARASDRNFSADHIEWSISGSCPQSLVSLFNLLSYPHMKCSINGHVCNCRAAMEEPRPSTQKGIFRKKGITNRLHLLLS